MSQPTKETIAKFDRVAKSYSPGLSGQELFDNLNNSPELREDVYNYLKQRGAKLPDQTQWEQTYFGTPEKKKEIPSLVSSATSAPIFPKQEKRDGVGSLPKIDINEDPRITQKEQQFQEIYQEQYKEYEKKQQYVNQVDLSGPSDAIVTNYLSQAGEDRKLNFISDLRVRPDSDRKDAKLGKEKADVLQEMIQVQESKVARTRHELSEVLPQYNQLQAELIDWLTKYESSSPEQRAELEKQSERIQAINADFVMLRDTYPELIDYEQSIDQLGALYDKAYGVLDEHPAFKKDIENREKRQLYADVLSRSMEAVNPAGEMATFRIAQPAVGTLVSGAKGLANLVPHTYNLLGGDAPTWEDRWINTVNSTLDVEKFAPSPTRYQQEMFSRGVKMGDYEIETVQGEAKAVRKDGFLVTGDVKKSVIAEYNLKKDQLEPTLMFNSEMVLPVLSQGVAQIAFYRGMGGQMAKGLTRVGMGANTAAKAGSAITIFSDAHNSLYQSLVQELGEEYAPEAGRIAATTALMWTATSALNPVEFAKGKVTYGQLSQTATRKVRDSLAKGLSRKAAVNASEREVSKIFRGIYNSGKNIAQAAREGGEEVFESIQEAGVRKVANNLLDPTVQLEDGGITIDRALNDFSAGLLAATPFSVGRKSKVFQESLYHAYRNRNILEGLPKEKRDYFDGLFQTFAAMERNTQAGDFQKQEALAELHEKTMVDDMVEVAKLTKEQRDKYKAQQGQAEEKINTILNDSPVVSEGDSLADIETRRNAYLNPRAGDRFDNEYGTETEVTDIQVGIDGERYVTFTQGGSILTLSERDWSNQVNRWFDRQVDERFPDTDASVKRGVKEGVARQPIVPISELKPVRYAEEARPMREAGIQEEGNQERVGNLSGEFVQSIQEKGGFVYSEETKGQVDSEIATSLDNALRTVKPVAGEVNTVFFDTVAQLNEYAAEAGLIDGAALREQGLGIDGVYSFKDNTVFLAKDSPRKVIYHELAHAFIMSSGKSKTFQKKFFGLTDQLMEDLSGIGGLRLQQFVSRYDALGDDFLKRHEALAEFVALIADGKVSLEDTTFLDRVRKFLKDLAGLVGFEIDLQEVSDVREFAGTIAAGMVTGKGVWYAKEGSARPEVREAMARLKANIADKLRNNKLLTSEDFEDFFRDWSFKSYDEAGRAFIDFVRSIGVDVDSSIEGVLFHGSNAAFSEFKKEKLGGFTGASSARMGFFFSDNIETSLFYGARDFNPNRPREEQFIEPIDNAIIIKSNYIYPVFIKSKNPLVLDAQGDYERSSIGGLNNAIQRAKNEGHDSLIVRNIYDPNLTDIYIAFEPNQIINAIEEINRQKLGEDIINTQQTIREKRLAIENLSSLRGIALFAAEQEARDEAFRKLEEGRYPENVFRSVDDYVEISMDVKNLNRELSELSRARLSATADQLNEINERIEYIESEIGVMTSALDNMFLDLPPMMSIAPPMGADQLTINTIRGQLRREFRLGTPEAVTRAIIQGIAGTRLTTDQLDILYKDERRKHNPSKLTKAFQATKVGAFMQDMAKLWKSGFAASRGVDKSIRDLRESQQGFKTAEVEKAANVARQYDKLVKKLNGDQKIIADRYLRGDRLTPTQQAQLPAELTTLLDGMRDNIQAMAQAMIDEGMVYGVTKEVILEHWEDYMTRAYRKYADPKHKPEQAIVDRALAMAYRYFENQWRKDNPTAPLDANVAYQLKVTAHRFVQENVIGKKPVGYGQGSPISRETGVLQQRAGIPRAAELYMEGVIAGTTGVELNNLAADAREALTKDRFFNLQQDDSFGEDKLGFSSKLKKIKEQFRKAGIDDGLARKWIIQGPSISQRASVTAAQAATLDDMRKAVQDQVRKDLSQLRANDPLLDGYDIIGLKEFREAMGEITNIGDVYQMTMGRMAGLLSTHRYFTYLKAYGLGNFLFDPRLEMVPVDRPLQKIAAEGSTTVTPLDGLMADPEVVEALRDVDDVDQYNNLFKAFINLDASIKYGKTILSPETHMRNMMGNIPFVLANGYFIPGLSSPGRSFRKSVSDPARITFKHRYGKVENKPARLAEVERLLDKLKKAGLLGQSVTFNTIKSAIGAESEIKDSTVDLPTFRRILKGKSWRNLGKKIWGKVETAYQFEDDIFKMYAYLQESQMRSWARYNKHYEDLSDLEREIVDNEAIEIVKNILPNYNRMGRVTRLFATRMPIVGNFLSFTLESWRVSANMIQQGVKDLADPSPKVKALGANRLIAGAGAYFFVKSAIAAAYTSADFASGFLISLVGDEDESIAAEYVKEKKEGDAELYNKSKHRLTDALRWAVYPHHKAGHDLLFAFDPQYEYRNGKFSYYSISQVDPHGAIMGPLNAAYYASKGEANVNILVGATATAFGPFVDQTILLDAIEAIRRNEDIYGDPIYNTHDEVGNQLFDAGVWAIRAIGPGVINSGMRAKERWDRTMAETEDKALAVPEAVKNQALMTLFGFREYKIDMNSKLRYEMERFDRFNGSNDFQAIFKDYYKDSKKNPVRARERATQRLDNAAQELRTLYEYGQALGLDGWELRKIMDDAKVWRPLQDKIQQWEGLVYPLDQ